MLWSVCSHHICGGDWPQSGDWAASFFLSGSDFSDCWLSRGLCFTLLFMFDHIWLYRLICVCLYVNVFLFGSRGVLWTAVLLTLKLPPSAPHGYLSQSSFQHLTLAYTSKNTKTYQENSSMRSCPFKGKILYYSMWIKTNWFHRLSNIQWLTEEMCEMYMPNHSICVSGGWCWFRGVDVVWVEWIQLSPFLPQCNLAWICPKLLYWINYSLIWMC